MPILLLGLNAIISLTNIIIMSYFILVITSITDIFMSKANRFELQIKAFWN